MLQSQIIEDYDTKVLKLSLLLGNLVEANFFGKLATDANEIDVLSERDV